MKDPTIRSFEWNPKDDDEIASLRVILEIINELDSPAQKRVSNYVQMWVDDKPKPE